MALITCKDCGNQVSDRAQFCPRCGAPVEIENVSGTGTSSHEADEKNCKANEGGVNNGSMSGSNTYLSGQPRYDKTLAGILAIFLGCFGVHHFYVGNNERGISYTFSGKYVKKFLSENNLDLLCRAHQVVEEGYEFFGNRQCVTVFSAPNYCGEFDNSGAIMDVDEELMCSFKVIKWETKT